jgi:hypothetical protein
VYSSAANRSRSCGVTTRGPARLEQLLEGPLTDPGSNSGHHHRGSAATTAHALERLGDPVDRRADRVDGDGVTEHHPAPGVGQLANELPGGTPRVGRHGDQTGAQGRQVGDDEVDAGVQADGDAVPG